ncbi:MAG: MoaD/ThiS family protein [Pseudonocardiaceae bacterium]|nr:MoaD/ThiS family protein [Pseudonocardiaceae bacterium]
MPEVTVRYFAGARAAAGVTSEVIELPDDARVSDVLEVVRLRHGDDLKRVLGACSFLLDAFTVHDLDTPVAAGAELDVLPPFAGG